MSLRWLALSLCCFVAFANGMVPAQGAEPAPFTLREGDRVVFLGNAFLERAQTYDYIETLLTAYFPGSRVVFRNLGWSGDTVFGEARAVFGTPEDGFNALKKQVLDAKPTVIVLGYGGNEAFEGAAGLPRFRSGLERLAQVLDATKARIVVLAPTVQEDLGRPLPDPAAHNRDLKRYRDALREFSHQRGYQFLDMYDLLGEKAPFPVARPITDDSLHLTGYGYWLAAQAMAVGLGLEPLRWRVTLGPEGAVEQERGTKVSEVERTAAGIRFEARDARLPGLPIATDAPAGGLASWGPMPILRVRGLPLGRYQLLIDGKPRGAASAQAWASGAPVLSAPQYDQVERLRQATVTKNQLFFYRWRPQNETYLFGFRKHEQGQNAREIPQFDPLVAEQEAVIAKLCMPAMHTYELKVDREEPAQ